MSIWFFRDICKAIGVTRPYFGSGEQVSLHFGGFTMYSYGIHVYGCNNCFSRRNKTSILILLLSFHRLLNSTQKEIW